MKTAKTLTNCFLAFGLLVGSAQVAGAEPMGTAFTYQGHLYDNNYPANGPYDFQFKLYDANSDGNQIGNDVNVPNVDVNNGYFTVELDFGSGVFDGDARWLGIGVRPSGDINDPCVLSPRQKVTPAPYAMYAKNAGYAQTATDADRVDGYHAGNSSDQVAVSNGALCANLNADKLDGYHYNNLPYIGGSGTAKYIPKFTGATTVGNSVIYESAAGNVGIGTTSPQGILHLQAASDPMLRSEIKGDLASLFKIGAVSSNGEKEAEIQFSHKLGICDKLNDSDPGRERVTILNNGNVGIGATSPAAKLTVNGNIYAASDISVNRAQLRNPPVGSGTPVVIDASGVLTKYSSSKRYKTNIQNLETDLQAVLQLQPVRFQWKATGQDDIGLIAEDVKEVLRDLVIYDGEGRPDAVRYDKVALYLLSVVKELKSENRSLQQRVEALEATIQQQQQLAVAKEVQQ